MEHTRPLCALQPGERARVERVTADEAMRRRLAALGLLEGTRVECVGTSPCGDPAAYRIRGAVIAIRGGDCAGILVRREPE